MEDLPGRLNRGAGGQRADSVLPDILRADGSNFAVAVAAGFGDSDNLRMYRPKFPSPRLIIPPVFSERQKGYLLYILEKLNGGAIPANVSIADATEARALARRDAVIFTYQKDPISEYRLLDAYIAYLDGSERAVFMRFNRELRARMGYADARGPGSKTEMPAALANLPVALPESTEKQPPTPVMPAVFDVPTTPALSAAQNARPNNRRKKFRNLPT